MKQQRSYTLIHHRPPAPLAPEELRELLGDAARLTASQKVEEEGQNLVFDPACVV